MALTIHACRRDDDIVSKDSLGGPRQKGEARVFGRGDRGWLETVRTASAVGDAKRDVEGRRLLRVVVIETGQSVVERSDQRLDRLLEVLERLVNVGSAGNQLCGKAKDHRQPLTKRCGD